MRKASLAAVRLLGSYQIKKWSLEALSGESGRPHKIWGIPWILLYS